MNETLTPARRWPLYVLGVLLLGALAAWGSREHTWSKRVDLLVVTNTTLTTDLSTAVTERDEYKKDTESAEDVVPVLMPGGVVAYATHRTSRTVETAMRESAEQIKALSKQVEDLKSKSTTVATETVKSTPMWNAIVGWDTLNATYYAGAGVNLGPLSLDLDNPLSLQLRPRLTGMIRF